MAKALRTDRKKLVCRAAVVVVLLYFAFNIISQQFRIAYYNSQKEQLATEIAQKQERYNELDSESKLYNTDEYIERTARTRLGLVRADETVFSEIGK